MTNSSERAPECGIALRGSRLHRAVETRLLGYPEGDLLPDVVRGRADQQAVISRLDRVIFLGGIPITEALHRDVERNPGGLAGRDMHAAERAERLDGLRHRGIHVRKIDL